MKMRNKMRGFTLIEAMIVVGLIGFIAAIGYPSYRDQVIKSRRSDGMAALLELADRMERHYSDVGKYTKADDTDIAVADVFPSFSSDYYTLSIVTPQEKDQLHGQCYPKRLAVKRQVRNLYPDFTGSQIGKRQRYAGSVLEIVPGISDKPSPSKGVSNNSMIEGKMDSMFFGNNRLNQAFPGSSNRAIRIMSRPLHLTVPSGFITSH